MVALGNHFRIAKRSPIVRKDILRVGRLRLADGAVWNVTRKLMARLVDNFRRYTANGNRVPWIWDHDGGAQDRIGDVIRLSLVGDTLWADCKITEQRFASMFGSRGEQTLHEVSVSVAEPWTDGNGNEYDACLLHLANVINPVVTHQGPFRRLLSLVRKRRTSMADEPAADGGGAKDTTVDTVKELKLFIKGKTGEEPAGITAADDATEISVADVYAMLMAYMGGETPEEEPTPPEEMEEMPDAAAAVNASLASRVKALEHQLSLVKATERTTYHEQVDTLIAENRITPADGKAIKAAADAAKVYTLSLLSPYRRLPAKAVPTVRRAGLGASANPPAVSDDKTSPIATPEQVKRAITDFWGVRTGGAK